MSITIYESVQEVAKRLCVTEGRVRQLLREGRFPGAIKDGSRERGVWRIIRNAHPIGPNPLRVRRRGNIIG